MKTYLIDPVARLVSLVECDYEKRGIQAIYDLIDADMFEPAFIFNDTTDAVYVDEEGLLKGSHFERAYFLIGDNPQPLCGKGLVLGMDDEGETIAPETPMESLRVRWLDNNTIAMLAKMNKNDFSMAVNGKAANTFGG